MSLPFRGHSTLRRVIVGVLAALLAACAAPPQGTPKADTSVAALPRLIESSWAELPGWSDDNLAEAWPALLRSCDVLERKASWKLACSDARAAGPVPVTLRQFFETHFLPFRVANEAGDSTGLITGYYEPLLRGSRSRTARFDVPLFAVPDDLIDVELSALYPDLKGMRLRGQLVGHTLVPYAPRAEIEARPSLLGKEIVWVDDRLAAFFMEIQGSGQVHLFENDQEIGTIRLSYADQNGYPYRAIGSWLVEHNEMTQDEVSMQSIVGWARAHPDRVDELLFSNRSYVFFKEAAIGDATLGPKGALGVALTPGRSIAIDARVVELGAPVYLDTTWPSTNRPLQRLTLAQDTGGAIAASQGRPARADLFFGMGDKAADVAGKMRQPGRMWVLLPRPQPATQ